MVPVSRPAADESVLIAAAQGGDHDAYGRLVAPHQAALHALCYRMLGSAADADDALQEALLRAWRGLRRFEGRSSHGQEAGARRLPPGGDLQEAGLQAGALY